MSRGKQSTIVTRADGSLVESHDAEISSCSTTSVLVRVHSVALNPSDHKIPTVVKKDGLVAGCDFAGEVVEVGADANALLENNRAPWTVGDRVCGAVQGGSPDFPAWGAFAEFVEADPLVLVRVPADWDWATAAALGGSCIGAVGLALFKEMQLDIANLEAGAVNGISYQAGSPGLTNGAGSAALSNSELKKIVLVYGGSTACGTIALQVLRLAGYTPITTCSPHNNALAAGRGAAATFDYGSPTCAADIKAHTRGALALVLDCVSTASSAALCYAALGRAGGRYVSLDKFPDALAASRRAVRAGWAMGPLMFGRRIALGEHGFDADPAARAFARRWFAVVQALVLAGRVRCHPVRVVGDGGGGGWTRAVLSGLDSLREGTVSGKKLVVRLDGY